MAHARRGSEDYFDGYNFKHHHSGLAGFTPEQVFTGRHHEVAKQKQQALNTRFKQNSERFVKGQPHVKMPPEFVAINLLAVNEDGRALIGDRVNFPTLTAAGYIGDK